MQGATGRTAWWTRWSPATIVFVASLLLYGTSPVVSNGDSYLAVPTSMSILHDFDLDLDEYLGPGTDGGNGYLQRSDGTGELTPGVQLPRTLAGTEWEHAFDHFPWTTAVLALPVIVVLELGGWVGIDTLDVDRMLADADTGLPNLIGGSLLAALTAAVITLVAGEAMSGRADRRRLAVIVGFTVALATPLWSTLSRALWSQSSSTLFVALSVLLASRISRSADGPTAGRRAGWLGVCAALAYTARPTAAVVVAGLGVWLLISHRRLLVHYVAGGVAVAIPWAIVNVATYSSIQPPNFSSDRAGFRSETLEAVAANLISPNRGLLVFSPIAIVAIAGAVSASRRTTKTTTVDRSLAITASVVVGLHLLLVSGSGESWWAGNSFGPRFMAETMPWLAVLAIPAVTSLADRGGWLRRGALVLLAMSIAANAVGAWSKPAACWNVDPVPIDADPSRVWDVDDMQILRPVEVLTDTGSIREAALGRCNDLLPGRIDR